MAEGSKSNLTPSEKKVTFSTNNKNLSGFYRSLYDDVKTWCEVKLAAPVIPLLEIEIGEGEGSLFNKAVAAACSQYWDSFPIPKSQIISVPSFDDITIKYDDAKDACLSSLSDEEKKIAFIKGILRITTTEGLGLAVSGVRIQGLLGLKNRLISSGNMDNTIKPWQEADYDILNADNRDKYSPDVVFLNDPIEGGYVISRIPSSCTSIEITWAFGFESSPSDLRCLKFVSSEYARLFKLMVLVHFLDTILGARTFLETEAEFTVNMGNIDTMLSELRANLEFDMKSTSLSLPLYG